MKNALITMSLAAAVLAGCASTPTHSTAVVQRENNQFEVTGIAKSQIMAKNNAVLAANQFCKRQSSVITNEQVKYNGVLDEKTGRMIDQATGIIGVFTGTKAPQMSRDDDYEISLQFYCK